MVLHITDDCGVKNVFKTTFKLLMLEVQNCVIGTFYKN